MGQSDKYMKHLETGRDSDSDEDEEFPSDTEFYGVLSEKLKTIDELIVVMSNGIQKYKDYMTRKNKVVLPEDLVTTLDCWFQHDNERNDYFDYLISQESADFDKVAIRILQVVEDQEKVCFIIT